jgi:hypothetical protein
MRILRRIAAVASTLGALWITPFRCAPKKTGTRHNPAREGKAVAANQRQIEPQVASLGMGVNLADKVPKKDVTN